MDIKIFISSPGDVLDERNAAETMIQSVAREPAYEHLHLRPIRWDKDDSGVMMDATISPQEAVNRGLPHPSECDIVIVILGSRMGTPLDASYNKKDGSRYLSGTEWEYDDAVEKGSPGKPAVWVFHRDNLPDPDPADTDSVEQAERLKALLDRIRKPGNDLRRDLNRYKSVQDFETHLRAGLQRHFYHRRFPFCVPPKEEHVLPRTETNALVNKLIAQKSKALVYLPGIGKTTLALSVAHSPKLKEHFDGILWADVGKDTDMRTELMLWAEALEISPQQTSNLATMEGWKKIVQNKIGDRHMLIILDDVWHQEAGDQFRSLAPNCTYLVTTRDQIIAHGLCEEEEDVEEIANLGPEESMELLEMVAPETIGFARRNHAELLKQIIESLDGLPLALSLVGKHLKGVYRRNDPEPLEDALKALQKAGALFKKQDSEIEGWATARLVKLLDVPYDALDSETLKRAFCSLSIFRPNPHAISKDMAAQICDVNAKQLQKLANAGLIALKEKAKYSIHRVFNTYAYEKLAESTRIELHRKAVRFYQEKIDTIAGAETLSYSSWYRYENTEWQQLQQARLYHLAHAEGHWAVAKAILRIYFDAFWWWGYYQPFAFCDALIKDWQQRTDSPDIKKILHELGEFRKYYPEGYEKHDRPGWDKVKDTLLALREDAQLGGDITSPDQRHVWALMEFFLAEAYAYSNNGDRSLALATYESARVAFEALGDDWNDSWISFYMADLLLDMGDGVKARDFCIRSIRLAESMPLLARDPEVLGNVYRLLGDIAFDRDDHDQAVDYYCRASFYAYAFQCIPYPPTANSPDTYTASFYEEITGRIASKVALAAAGNPTIGRQMLDRIQAYWALYCSQSGDPATLQDSGEIAAYLFPVPPSAEEALTKSTAYRDQVKQVIDSIKLGLQGNC